MNLINERQFTAALHGPSPILAVCTQPDSAERLEQWSAQAVAAGRQPVVLAPGMMPFPGYTSARAWQRHLAAGTILDAAGLIAWWTTCWWGPVMAGHPSFSRPMDDELVLLGKAVAHQVVLQRARLGRAFSIGQLQELLSFDALFALFNPSLTDPGDPLLVNARDATARYAQTLRLPIPLDQVSSWAPGITEAIRDQHGYNQQRLGMPSRWIDGAVHFFHSSRVHRCWDAATWLVRGDVVLIGGPPGMFTDPTYHEHNRNLFGWITADLQRGLSVHPRDVPGPLLCLDDDPTRQVGFDGLGPWLERQALYQAVDGMGTHETRERSRL